MKRRDKRHEYSFTHRVAAVTSCFLSSSILFLKEFAAKKLLRRGTNAILSAFYGARLCRDEERTRLRCVRSHPVIAVVSKEEKFFVTSICVDNSWYHLVRGEHRHRYCSPVMLMAP